MTILGIDTSCDDTCIAILKIKNGKINVLSNIVSSQIEIHKKYGGVFPSLAKREHQKNLPLVLNKALKKAKVSQKDIDAIAITIGPGLEPCLWVGINFAKELAKKWPDSRMRRHGAGRNKPLIPVNHIEGHLLANFLPQISKNFQFSMTPPKARLAKGGNFQRKLPAIGLIVSGGHTQLILIKKIGKYEIIGETRDDAAGECFDKTARILGLPYPGGPAIALLASKLPPTNYKLQTTLPRPMLNSKDYDFSFSGLKTAVLYSHKNQPIKMKKSPEYVKMMAKEIQQSIVDVLIKKTIRATKDFRVKTIILGGGVAANEELRKQFKLKIKNCKLKIDFFVPKKDLCTDNAAMIALTGYFNRKKATKNLEKISADSNLRL